MPGQKGNVWGTRKVNVWNGNNHIKQICISICPLNQISGFRLLTKQAHVGSEFCQNTV